MTILTNAAIFSFTLRGVLNPPTLENQVLMFLLISGVFIIFRYTVQTLVGGLPKSISKILARQREIDKRINKQQFHNRGVISKTGLWLDVPKDLKQKFFNLQYIKEK